MYQTAAMGGTIDTVDILFKVVGRGEERASGASGKFPRSMKQVYLLSL